MIGIIEFLHTDAVKRSKVWFHKHFQDKSSWYMCITAINGGHMGIWYTICEQWNSSVPVYLRCL